MSAALALATMIVLVPPSPAIAGAAARPPAAMPIRERLRIFDLVWREVRDRYYDPGLNGVDWTAVAARFRPRVSAASGESEFVALLRAMLGELRDAHTRILTARQAEDRRQGRTMTTGVILFEVEGHPVVFDVRPDSPAAEAGLRPGMRVLEVDGVAAAAALGLARAEIGPSSSGRASLVLAYLKLVSGRPEEELRLRLADGNRPPFDVALRRRPLDTAPRFESRLLPSGHLYVRFDRFRKPVARRFRAALEQWRDARGLILDLRSNTGGDGKEGMRTIAPLLASPTLVARLATRTGKAPSALAGLVKLPLRLVAGKAGGQVYGGPVAILTNQGTGSTSEVIAASLQERGRARIVGTQSCGCALGVLKYRKLGNGAELAISEVGLLSGLGRRIEGRGVTPDVGVDLKLSDLERGSDPVLEAAVRLLASGGM